MNQLLVVSPSPHVHDKTNTPKLMYGVVLALLPALAVSFYYFGIGAIIVTSTAIISCLFFEWIIQKYLLKEEVKIKDGSAIVTGLLLSFCLPANLPLWIIILGSLVAIGVGKMSFGGLGQNPFNPALVGRVFLFISYPVQMTSWPKPKPFFSQKYLDA
ncbi:MAG: RnfABCDGE type electron transport complex subunit D, partial [Bacteroidota bacterium]